MRGSVVTRLTRTARVCGTIRCFVAACGDRVKGSGDTTVITAHAQVGEEARLQEMWRTHCRGGGRAAPDDAWVPSLTRELEELVAGSQYKEYATGRDEAVTRLQRIASGAFDGATVVPFGSSLTGLWTPQSDLDVCLLIPGINTRGSQVHALKKVGKALRRSGTHIVSPRLRAQMPILRWEPRGAGRYACDISINNTLAVANSRLVAQYMAVDARVPVLALAVKAWARCRGINDRSRGTFSSFALTLMLIHFLQHRNVPVLPSLQDVAILLKYPAVFIQGNDCRFCDRSSDVEAALNKLRGVSPPNDESAGLLLHDFFRHYGYDYERGPIAIRDRSEFATREDEGLCYLLVDNPFEPGKDVANIEVRLYTRLREEIRRAHALLNNGSTFADVCHPPPSPGTCPLSGPALPGVNTPLGFPTH